MKPNLTSDAKTNTFSANERAGCVARQPRMMNEAITGRELRGSKGTRVASMFFGVLKKCFLLIKRCNILD